MVLPFARGLANAREAICAVRPDQGRERLRGRAEASGHAEAAVVDASQAHLLCGLVRAALVHGIYFIARRARFANTRAERALLCWL
jgi:hypothetical protein